MVNKNDSIIELTNARAERYKQAQRSAEFLLEKKSRELYAKNQELQVAQENLKDDIEQATLELNTSNQQLHKMLDEKSNFIDQISHEVRTPLHAIIGLSEILLKTELEHQQIDFTETILSSAKSLINLLNDTLDLTKIETGRMAMNPSLIEIQTTLQQIVKMFIPQAQQQHSDLTLDIIKPLPKYIYIDESRFTQVINNLLSNAIKHTSNGSIKLHADYQQHDDGEAFDNLNISIIDTGVGIDKSQLDTIFAPYKQVDDSGQGVGLGLAICKQICDLMSASITCESEYGKGSVFSVCLPINKLAVGDNDITQTNESNSSITSNKLRILIAEDNKINQKVISLQLAQLGQSADIVNNGIEALEKLEKYQYDIVYIDIFMPKMNGEDTIKAIRSHSTLSVSQHYCVALTASNKVNHKQHLLNLGFDAFLSKPLTLNQLSMSLQKTPTTSQTQDINNSQEAQTRYDFTHFEKQFGADYKAVFMQVAPVFLEHAYEQLEDLKSQVANGQSEEIKRTSHSMKGAASSMGLTELAQHFLYLETHYQDSDLQTTLEIIIALMADLKPSIELELASDIAD